MRHFTRKPELVPDILQAIVDLNGSDLSIRTSYDLNLEAALKDDLCNQSIEVTAENKIWKDVTAM